MSANAQVSVQRGHAIKVWDDFKFTPPTNNLLSDLLEARFEQHQSESKPAWLRKQSGSYFCLGAKVGIKQK